MSDAFDAVSELRDKQLFSDSKSDMNVFTDALVKIGSAAKLTQQDDDTLGPSPLK